MYAATISLVVITGEMPPGSPGYPQIRGTRKNEDCHASAARFGRRRRHSACDDASFAPGTILEMGKPRARNPRRHPALPHARCRTWSVPGDRVVFEDLGHRDLGRSEE